MDFAGRTIPTYISGPLFRRTSKNRQRFGQRDGFPGLGSLGHIQPNTGSDGILKKSCDKLLEVICRTGRLNLFKVNLGEFLH